MRTNFGAISYFVLSHVSPTPPPPRARQAENELLRLRREVSHSTVPARVIARPRMKGGALLRHIFQPFLVSVFSASLATMLAISVMYHSG